MFDTSHALADMASQIRTCRNSDGLTLQQLANRSGVAASTIHKVEARQMVPTVSVLLKIAKGLGRRPDELIRDQATEIPPDSANASRAAEANGSTPNGSVFDGFGGSAANGSPTVRSGEAAPPEPIARHDVGVWHIDVAEGHPLPRLDLDPTQRAIVLVEKGEVSLRAAGRSVRMDTGDCIEVEGGEIQSPDEQHDSASLMLIVSPPGNLGQRLGAPESSAPTIF